jgi:hypothetical protein
MLSMRFGRVTADAFKEIEGADGVALEILARISDRGGDRDLARAMDDQVEVATIETLLHFTRVPEIQLFKSEVTQAAEPGEIHLGAAARKIVPHRHRPSVLQEATRGVGADESRAAGDENALLFHI